MAFRVQGLGLKVLGLGLNGGIKRWGKLPCPLQGRRAWILTNHLQHDVGTHAGFTNLGEHPRKKRILSGETVR